MGLWCVCVHDIRGVTKATEMIVAVLLIPSLISLAKLFL